MGFFYQNAKASAKSKGNNKIENLKNIGYEQECKACPLNKTVGLRHPKMEPTGNAESYIYILGEAPGEEEDETGTQFIGDSGQILRSGFEDEFQTDLDGIIRWNNIIRCRPRSGKKNRPPTELEIECCRKSIESDILKTKPAVIVGFGNVPLRWFLRTDGILIWRGHFIPINVQGFKTWFYPMVHPSFILRGRNNKEDPWERTFHRDVARLKDWLDQEPLPKPVVIDSGFKDGITCVFGEDEDDLNVIKEALSYFKTLPSVALDIETVRLRPFQDKARMLCVSIGTNTEVIAFPLDHPKAWNVLDRPLAIKLLYEMLKDFLLTSGIKVAHNLKFELEWFHHQFSPDILFKTDWGDTQAISYLLNERTSKQTKMHSLDSCCLLNFGFHLKSITEVDRTENLIDYEIEDLLLYNGMDSKYTYMLFKKTLPLLDIKRLKIYNLLNDTAKTLVRSQYKGIHLDKDVVKKLSTKMEGQIIETYKKIFACPEVKKFEKQYEIEFKPTSSDHLVTLFEEVLGLQPVKKTAKEGYSTDHTVLEQFAKEGIQVASHLITLREQSKLYSTYIEPALTWLSPDGLIHPQYNHLGTGTGRLSSSDPVNVQNFPNKKGAWIREEIKAPKGYVLAAFDQGQIEARNIAMASGDTFFCEAIKKDYDIHKEWAINVIKAYPAVVGARNFKEVTDLQIKAMRKRTKNELVFPWFYLAGVYSVGRALGLPDHIVEKLYEDFWEMFAGVKKWQERTIKFYNENGFVETLTGRRRHEPLDISMIVNSPIQGTASDIVVESGNRMDKIAYEREDPNLIYVLEIHDDLTFYLPEDKLEFYIPFIAEQLVKPMWPFIKDIPLSVECKIGPDWYHMEEVAVYRTGDFW